jgi:hypothetical protein
VKIISGHLRSTYALGVISSFVLFLAASAPHRVHHLFENLPKPHGHGLRAHSATQPDTAGDTERQADAHSDEPLHADAPHNDQNHDPTAQTVCVLQSAAQHSHLSSAQLVEIALHSIESEGRYDDPSFRFSSFSLSPFSQRAHQRFEPAISYFCVR